MKEGEVEQKMRYKGGGRAGVMLFDRGGFSVGSW